MIRVSDRVEEQLKAVADGRSMNATIEKMLAFCSSPEGFCPAPQDTASYEPYLLEQMNKRFDELKALIEDTTVDRVAGRAAPTNHTLVPPEISWPVAQEMFFDYATDEDFVAAGVKKALEDSPNLDEATFYIKDGIIYSMFYGTERPLVKLTPHIESFLSEKGVL